MEQQIKSTTNYNMFKVHPLNRPVSQDHVHKLIQSIKANNQLDINPIVIDTEKHVISGQHRLEAARYLKVPIYYVEKDVNSDFILLANQCQRRTNLDDAITYYIATRDDMSYKLLEKARKEFGIPYGSCAALIGEIVGRKAQITCGSFKISGSEEEAKVYLDKYRDLRNIVDNLPFSIKNAYKCTHFCVALRKLMENEDVDWENFLLKMRNFWSMLDCAMPTTSKWYDQFLRIYNKHKRIKVGQDDDDE